MTKKTLSVDGADLVDRGDIDLDAEDVRLADGSRLTEARARELADEVVQAARRGRPSLTGAGHRSPQLRLSVPKKLRDDLRARAAAEHRSVSEIAREAISQFLAS